MQDLKYIGVRKLGDIKHILQDIKLLAAQKLVKQSWKNIIEKDVGAVLFQCLINQPNLQGKFIDIDAQQQGFTIIRMLSFVFTYPGETNMVIRKIGVDHYEQYGVTKELMQDWINGFLEFVSIYDNQEDTIDAWRMIWHSIEREFFYTIKDPFTEYTPPGHTKDVPSTASSGQHYFGNVYDAEHDYFGNLYDEEKYDEDDKVFDAYDKFEIEDIKASSPKKPRRIVNN
eukprot:UN24115